MLVYWSVKSVFGEVLCGECLHGVLWKYGPHLCTYLLHDLR